jgi:hypothetical protein
LFPQRPVPGLGICGSRPLRGAIQLGVDPGVRLPGTPTTRGEKLVAEELRLTNSNVEVQCMLAAQALMTG